MNLEYISSPQRKIEFTEHLVETLTLNIYEGLVCIYEEANSVANKNNESGNKILIIFQIVLRAITWDPAKINNEINRNKELDDRLEYFRDLIRFDEINQIKQLDDRLKYFYDFNEAINIANIILLISAKNISDDITKTFHNSIISKTFIHGCYKEYAKNAHNNPNLFYHEMDPLDYKKNQILIKQQIRDGITLTITKFRAFSMIKKDSLIL